MPVCRGLYLGFDRSRRRRPSRCFCVGAMGVGFGRVALSGVSLITFVSLRYSPGIRAASVSPRRVYSVPRLVLGFSLCV